MTSQDATGGDTVRAGSAVAEGERWYRELFESLVHPCCVVEVIFDGGGRPVDFRFLEANPAFADRATGPMMGKRIKELVPAFEQSWLDQYGRVATTGEPARLEHVIPGLGDQGFRTSAFRLGGPGSRRVGMLFEHLTDREGGEAAEAELARMRRRADEVNAFRVRFSDAVEGLTDPQAVARTACRMIREQLCTERAYWAELDWAAREWVVGAAYDGSEASVIEGRFPFDAWEPFTSDHLAGRPVVVHDTQQDPRIPPAMRDGYARLGVGADLGAAATTGGKARAALVVNQRPPRHWTDEEVALVRDVAARCWGAVERARAEAALRENEARQAFLLKLSDALRPLAGADAARAAACRLLAEGLGLDRAYYSELDEGEGVGVVANDHARDGVPSMAGRYRIADFGWVMPPLRRGETVVVSDVASDPRIPDAERPAMSAVQVRAQVTVPVIKGGALVGAFCAATMGPRPWAAADVERVQDTAERVWAAVERARSEAAAREAEARVRAMAEVDRVQRVLVAEIQHRSRNLLAVVRSIVSQTLRGARSLADAEARIGDRLSSLSRVHGLLSRSETPHVTVRELVDMELGATAPGAATRATVAGPDVILPARAVRTFSLALHELFTNAVKHGALDGGDGHVRVEWRVSSADGAPRLVLEWIERSEPGRGADPSRRGFGRTLIEQALPYELDATTELVIRDGSVRCRIDLPLAGGAR